MGKLCAALQAVRGSPDPAPSSTERLLQYLETLGQRSAESGDPRTTGFFARKDSSHDPAMPAARISSPPKDRNPRAAALVVDYRQHSKRRYRSVRRLYVAPRSDPASGH